MLRALAFPVQHVYLFVTFHFIFLTSPRPTTTTLFTPCSRGLLEHHQLRLEPFFAPLNKIYYST
jgi:hypothetical protein